jgi:thiamine-monophosphate kinase
LHKNFSRKNQKRGTVTDLGERKIIEMIRRSLDAMPNIPVPFDDDVSAVEIDKSHLAVLKTDMLVGKTDVPKGMSFWQAARKAIVMNVSDFAAKGVQPSAALVSLGIPCDFLTKDIDELARGLNAGARQYGLYVIGGDTGESGDLIISISMYGKASKTNIMLRNGAKPGDIVAVTGFFGKTAAGLHLIMDGDAASTNLHQILLSSICMPQARLREGLALGKTHAVTSSIDSSDGLAWCLHEIARMSDVGFLINGLPVAEEVVRFAEFNNIDANKLALYGGEEYELVVTVKQKEWVNAETACESAGGQLLPIGKVTRDKQVILDVDGCKEPIDSRGYEHFKSTV